MGVGSLVKLIKSVREDFKGHTIYEKEILVALQGRPQTRFNALVFPYNIASKVYSMSEFNEQLLEGKATKSEVFTVLENFKKFLFIQPYKSIIALQILTLLYIFFATFLLTYLSLSGYINEKYHYAFFIAGNFLILFALIFLKVALRNYLMSKSKVKANKEIKEYIGKVNADFVKRGVSWKLGKYYAWAEIDLRFVTDRATQQDNNGNTVITKDKV